MARSVKTTVGGVGAGLVLIGQALSDAAETGFNGKNSTQIVVAVLIAFMGVVARDYNVSSEGKKIDPPVEKKSDDPLP